MSDPLFVTCIPGLEELLAAEVKALGFEARAGSGGVFVPDTSFTAILALNYQLRLAHRVLLPLTRFRCKDKENLYKGVLEVDWKRYFKKGWTLAVNANGVSDELRNTQFSAQVVKDGVCDRLIKEWGARPNVSRQAPDVRLNLHLHRDWATLYYDTSNIPLYKRGYRKETGPAPMQESLAAAILRIAGYTGEQGLCDPCCGSGTLLIEAAMLATHLPAGFFRTAWGFMRLPEFNEKEWKKKRGKWDAARTLFSGKLIGVEKSPDAFVACKANLRAAGLTRKVEMRKSSFQEEKLTCDLVVTNPPYGERMQAKMEPLYRDLGAFIRRCKAPAAYVLTGWEEGGEKIGLPVVQAAPLLNGGLDCTLFELEYV